ncbi:MAG: PorP/SprF family type IX secretion system membrane protein [Lewinellaceae bacterium]|nr:PorP/SprF family type IX secretion system membrane protein [Lewinellaceae bacterium]
MRTILYLWLLAFWVMSPGLKAQDLHFSQFGYSPVNLNPALTGIFRGNLRLTGNFRSQWSSVPVDFLTFSASADFKLPNQNPESNGFFALGGAFNYDQAGASKLYLVNGSANLSYTRRLHKKLFLTAGVQLGGSNRGFDIDPLLFNTQYDRGTSEGNPGLPSGESFSGFRNSFFDLGTGLNFRWQDYGNCEIINTLKKRSFLDLGIGLFHVNKPDQAFDDGDNARLAVRLSPYFLGNLQVDENFDAFLNTNFQFQGPYKEWLVSAGGRVYLNKTPGNQLSMAFSGGYRFNNEFGDSFFPAIEVQVGPVYGAISYDINLSDYKVATGRRGGWELTVRYMLGGVCINNYFCPLL